MIYRATKEQIETYFATDAISQSQLKLYMKGYDEYQKSKEEALTSEKYFDEPKEHFVIGHAVDMKLTGIPEDFASTYHISILTNKPSDTEISIIMYVFDKLNQQEFSFGNYGTLMDHKVYLGEAFEYHNYQARWGLDAKLNAFNKDVMTMYWYELCKSAGKQILTMEQLALINALVYNFKNAEATRHLFDEDNNLDIIYQLPLYARFGDYNIKGLVDIVVINHENKTIFFYDIKTMADSVLNFPLDYKKRKYGFQGAYYYNLRNSISIYSLFNNINYPNAYMIDDEYQFIDFNFAVASKSFPSTPAVVFNMGIAELVNIVQGKPVTYITSTDNIGGFYQTEQRAVLSISDWLYNFDCSVKFGFENRVSSYGVNLITDY